MFKWFWKIVKSLRPTPPTADDRFPIVGQCRICEQGLLGVRLCGGDHSPLVLCDECESVWTDPSCAGGAQALRNPGSLCPLCQRPAFSEETSWANEKEIAELGWKEHIVGYSRTDD